MVKSNALNIFMITHDPPYPHQLALHHYLQQKGVNLIDPLERLKNHPRWKDESVRRRLLEAEIQKIDAVIFPGDDNVAIPEDFRSTPASCTDARLLAEREAFFAAQKLGKPVLGICQGFQLATVLLGGSLDRNEAGHFNEHFNAEKYCKLQDKLCDMQHEDFTAAMKDSNFRSEFDQLIQTYEKPVRITNDSFIAPKLKRLNHSDDMLSVTCLHYHGVFTDAALPKDVFPLLQDKGVIEAYIHKREPIIGCQFHPELNENTAQIFIDSFLEYSRYQRAAMSLELPVRPLSMTEWANVSRRSFTEKTNQSAERSMAP